MNDHEFEEFVETSYMFMDEAIASCNDTWDFQSYQQWDMSQDTGLLIFSEGPNPAIVCKVQIVGTYQSTRNYWRWSWANESIDDYLKVDMEKVRQFGIDNDIYEITTDAWEARNEDDAWAMTAITAKLLDAMSVYRGPEGPLYIYMIVSSVEWK